MLTFVLSMTTAALRASRFPIGGCDCEATLEDDDADGGRRESAAAAAASASPLSGNECGGGCEGGGGTLAGWSSSSSSEESYLRYAEDTRTQSLWKCSGHTTYGISKAENNTSLPWGHYLN